jgi:formate dehydrogenase maturation protein FdhE
MARTAVAEPIPLGSLTQPASRTQARCPACTSDRLTELAMTLTDGTPVRFSSCRACEHRTWRGVQGDVLPITQVLDRTRKLR